MDGFYEAGRTYSVDGLPWKFQCDIVTTHPEGDRVALGWRYHSGQWEPYAYYDDDWDLLHCGPQPLRVTS